MCLFLPTFSVLVANPHKLLDTVAKPATCRGLLNREVLIILILYR